jgi:hypothetical protein
MKHLIIELRFGSQPFTEDFEVYGSRVTDAWLKSVWEKVYLFSITIEESKVALESSWEEDKWLMPVLV